MADQVSQIPRPGRVANETDGAQDGRGIPVLTNEQDLREG